MALNANSGDSFCNVCQWWSVYRLRTLPYNEVEVLDGWVKVTTGKVRWF